MGPPRKDDGIGDADRGSFVTLIPTSWSPGPTSSRHQSPPVGEIALADADGGDVVVAVANGVASRVSRQDGVGGWDAFDALPARERGTRRVRAASVDRFEGGRGLP